MTAVASSSIFVSISRHEQLLARSKRMASRSYRVALVEPHPLQRAGLHALLRELDFVDVVAVTDKRGDVADFARRSQPHVLFCSLDGYAGGTGDAMRSLLANISNHTFAVVVTIGESRALERWAIENLRLLWKAGASAFLAKSEISAPILRELIAAVTAGETPWVSSQMAHVMFRMQLLSQKRAAARATLTPRELEVVSLIGDGQADDTIADALGVSPVTIRNHANNARWKLDLRSRHELTAWAWRNGVVGDSNRGVVESGNRGID